LGEDDSLEDVDVDALLALELLVLSPEQAVVVEFLLKLEDATFPPPFEDVPPLGKRRLHHLQTHNISLSLDFRL